MTYVCTFMSDKKCVASGDNNTVVVCFKDVSLYLPTV